MKAQAQIQKLLKSRLLDLQSKNPSFSLRAFSKKLGISPGAISELLKGQRRASRKLAERITTRLMLDPQESHQILKHFDEIKSKRLARDQAESESREYLRLTADQFTLIAEWTHYAILSLIETTGFHSDARWIASRLGVSVPKVEASLERLDRLGLITISKDGHIQRAFAQIHTPDDVFSISIQKAHLGDMELAKEALQNVPVELRDFTSISVPASTETMPALKKLIRQFREEAAALLAAAPTKTEVYQMSIYVYPLTENKPLTQAKKTPTPTK